VLDLSGQRRYGAASATEQYRATFYQFHETILGLEQQIRDAYWTLAAARGQAQIATVSLKEAQRIYDLTVKQEQAGSSPKSDVIRSSIDVANAKQILLASQAADRSAQISFNVLLSQPPTTPVMLSSDLTQDTAAVPIELPGSIEDLNKQALAERPLLKAANSQAVAAKYFVQQAESTRLPDLNIDFQKSVVHSTNLMVFGLSFPLLDFGSVGHSIRAAKELKKQADAVKIQTEHEVIRQVAQAYTDLKYAIEAASSYKKDILYPSVTLLSMAQLGYQQGATGILPIIDAESTIRNARVGYITSLLSVYKAQDELQAALGTPSIATSPKKP
jgi:outer membrane protein TolC